MTISSPNFIIHAAGSLGNRPDLGKKPYRLKCRFQVPAGSGPRVLEQAKYLAAEQFVADMAKQGFDYIGESDRLEASQRGFRMAFKGAHVEIRSLPRPKRPPSSREMLPLVMQGAKFRATDEPGAITLPHFTQVEFWDYELSAVFIRDTIWSEIPDLREEHQK